MFCVEACNNQKANKHFFRIFTVFEISNVNSSVAHEKFIKQQILLIFASNEAQNFSIFRKFHLSQKLRIFLKKNG
jgi:hypothetical protein